MELAARRQWGALADLDRDDGWDEERWFAAFEPYFAEHDSIGVGPDARSASMVAITEEPDRWVVHQIIEDPEGHHEWRILAEVDLAASDETGTAEVTVLAVGPAAELVGLTSG